MDQFSHSADTKINSRPYQSANDFEHIQRFLQNCVTITGRSLGYLHPGDVAWRMYRALEFDPNRHIHLWETHAGELVGFTWFYNSHNGVDIQIHPLWFESHLLTRMVRWAERHSRRELPNRGRGQQLRIGCFDDDRRRGQLLNQLGYRPDVFHYVHLQRPLSAEDGGRHLQLPNRFFVRATRRDESDARARLHNAAFTPSAVTGDSYQRVMDSPNYEAAGDLLIEGPDNRLAAFALCWLDRAHKVGLFEPVGTHPDFRRKGLARAALFAGLKYMAQQGMQTAWVYTESPNINAQKLYASLGFRVTGRDFDCVKRL